MRTALVSSVHTGGIIGLVACEALFGKRRVAIERPNGRFASRQSSTLIPIDSLNLLDKGVQVLGAAPLNVRGRLRQGQFELFRKLLEEEAARCSHPENLDMRLGDVPRVREARSRR